jgi:acetyltransferase-like isoleucine patch superfamily enzyme
MSYVFMIIDRVIALYKNSGFVLFFCRLPVRITKTILNKATTAYYASICQEFGRSTVVEFGAHIEVPRKVKLGSNVFIASGTTIQSETNSGLLTIKDSVHVGNNCHIDHTGNLEIGERTLLSDGVRIISHSHGYDPRSNPQPIDKHIGADCWLGIRALILENSSYIANSTIVAANAVLTKDITKNNRVYAGIPAKEIGHNAS